MFGLHQFCPFYLLYFSSAMCCLQVLCPTILHIYASYPLCFLASWPQSYDPSAFLSLRATGFASICADRSRTITRSLELENFLFEPHRWHFACTYIAERLGTNAVSSFWPDDFLFATTELFPEPNHRLSEWGLPPWQFTPQKNLNWMHHLLSIT